jgi:hypothetical protein
MTPALRSTSEPASAVLTPSCRTSNDTTPQSFSVRP